MIRGFRSIADEVDFVRNLSRDVADRIILPRVTRIKRKNTKDTTKKEFVTKEDLQTSLEILAEVRTFRPGSYSEEHKDESRFAGHEYLWLFDSFDGTRECEKIGKLKKDEAIQQYLGYFSVLGALLERQADRVYFPIAGFIYQPSIDETWFSYDNEHIAREVGGSPAHLPKLKDRKLVGFTRREDPGEHLPDFYRFLGDELNRKVRVVGGGGSGSSVAALLRGEVNLVINPFDNTSEWDIAAAVSLVRARGGWVCDLDWNDFTFNRRDHYNRRGYAMSIVFDKHQIMPIVQEHAGEIFQNRLN